MKKKIAIFISGRGSNMEAIARNEALKASCEILLVFANKQEAKGLAIAQQLGIPTACIPSKGKKRVTFDKQVLALLSNYAIDYIVLAGYMRLLSPLFIQTYQDRIINIHPADTTKHQGIRAYEWAFENNLPSTKITVHLVDEGTDTGKVLAQAEVDLTGVKTLEEVEQRGLRVEHQFYSKVLQKIFKH